MNRWQAITHIVSTFVNRGHPGYALLALAIVLLSSIATMALAYVLGAPFIAALN